MLILAITCLLAGSSYAQRRTREKLEEAKRSGDPTMVHIYMKMAEEDEYVAAFISRAPQEQVQLWLQGAPRGLGQGLADKRIEKILIAHGTATAPYLAGVLRSGNHSQQLAALELLCQMDRFVPRSQLVLNSEDLGYDELIDTRGAINTLDPINGQRIGQTAYEAVMWAAEQTSDEELRFQARRHSGLLEQDLRRLPLEEQLKQWRAAVLKDKGSLYDSEAGTISFYLGYILPQEAPESLPPLIEVLNHDPSGYVREAAIGVVMDIDSERMRLRKTELGRQAIAAIQSALEKGGLQPDFTSRKVREEVWAKLSANLFNDDMTRHFDADWNLYAKALEQFYGVKLTRRIALFDKGYIVEAAPEIRAFIAYLTEDDPYFPSWVYTPSLPGSQIFHPQFKTKIERYYEAWKKYKLAR
jgi:hypothetical protein